MGSFMIWQVYFKNKKAKKWFEEEYKLKPIHHHYMEGDLFEEGDFYYEGYFGYAEAEEGIKLMKKNGIKEIFEFRMCDFSDNRKVFEKVREEK